MQSLLLGLAVLACPIGMGVMMWMGNRAQRTGAGGTGGQGVGGVGGDRSGGGDVVIPDQQQQVVELRAEIEQLKAVRGGQRAGSGQ